MKGGWALLTAAISKFWC